jgi:hypothetical protein
MLDVLRRLKVQRVVIQSYFWFGTAVRYLEDAATNYLVHADGGVLHNLREYFRILAALNLTVTKRASAELEAFAKRMEAIPEGSALSQVQATELSKLMSKIRDTLEAELLGSEAWVVSPKRYDTQRLLNDPGSLFAPDVFESMPEICRFDFAEAAKCVAFERSTAAAFHLMRGTEGVLRSYYCHFVIRNRCNPLLWYPMLQGLQTHRIAKKNDVLHRNLDNIRLSFRNPTQHPEKTYDIHESQDLWGLSVDVVNRMIKAMKKNV